MYFVLVDGLLGFREVALCNFQWGNSEDRKELLGAPVNDEWKVKMTQPWGWNTTGHRRRRLTPLCWTIKITLSKTYKGSIKMFSPHRQSYEIITWLAADSIKSGRTGTNKWISDGGIKRKRKLTHLFYYVCREDSGGEGSTEDVRKLLVKAADTHPLKVPVWADDGLARLSGLGFSCRGSDENTKCLAWKESPKVLLSTLMSSYFF